MTKKIPALTARTHLGEIMKKTYLSKDRFIVEKSGIPMVAIISVDEFKNLMEARQKRFKVYNRIKKRTKNIPQKEINKDIVEAIKAVREK